MPFLIHDTTLLTPLGDGMAVRPHTSIRIAEGFVVEIAPAGAFLARITAGEFDEVVCGRQHLTVPGFVNTHHHLFQALTRCLPAAQNAHLFRWLLALYERWRHLDAYAVRTAAQISIAELLLHGCTTTSDHFYMFPRGSDVRIEAVLEAAAVLGIRLHLCRGSMSLGQRHGGLPPDDCVEDDDAILADCVHVLDAYHDPRPGALRRIDLAPCSPFNVTPELLRDTRVLARERGVLLHTHLAETLEEEAFCLERFGCRPLQYLADLDWLGPDVYLAHGVHLSAVEIAQLARTQTGVSHNPVSNMRLGSGVAPLQEWLAAGVRVGLGVDGASSNDGGNILAVGKQALLLARLRTALGHRPGTTGAADGAAATAWTAEGAPLLPAAVVLRLLTAGGAACLNRPELGHLDIGSAADVAMFRRDDPALAGAAAQDPVAALVLCDAPRADRVFVAGREVVRAGRLTALDELALGAEFEQLVAARFVR